VGLTKKPQDGMPVQLISTVDWKIRNGFGLAVFFTF